MTSAEGNHARHLYTTKLCSLEFNLSHFVTDNKVNIFALYNHKFRMFQ